MTTRRPAEVFPPGDFIRDEIEARGWTQADLATILGRPVQMINELIAGKRGVTPDTAQGLGEAFGTGPELWMNLEAAYQLWRAQQPDAAIARRAKIFSKGPIHEMTRRGWLQRTDSVDVLERQILEFFEIDTIDAAPAFAHAARKSGAYDVLTPAQCAWLFWCRRLARGEQAPAYSAERLAKATEALRALMEQPEDVARVPDVLKGAGVRLVIVEALARTRIDGATFWLGPRAPVIALSVRFDRIDSFWYTLGHELGHVYRGDGLKNPTVDIDLIRDRTATSEPPEKPAQERRADAFAMQLLVPQARLDAFVAETKPYYSKQRILAFADTLQVHPGLVVGQLQHRKEITYSHSREMLVRVREHVTAAATTDGWGCRPTTPA